MKFIVDAQLPYGLKSWLISEGFDAIHTRDLPAANATKDLSVADVADEENRAVITKDSDFLKLYSSKGQAAKTFDDYDGEHRQQRVSAFV